MKHTKKLLSLLLVLCLILSLSCTAFAADEAKPLTGKTVILHSNDVHGAIDLYAAMASLKADYEAQGAEVILADAGDYSPGHRLRQRPQGRGRGGDDECHRLRCGHHRQP